MANTYWNDLEEEALLGLPWLAQLFYLRVLRRSMDFRTGLVGKAPYGVTWGTLALLMHVDPARGRPASECGEPSLKALRFAVELLVRKGLVEMRSADKYLIFFLPMADRDDSVSGNRGRRRADVGQVNRGRPDTSNDKASDEIRGRRGAEGDNPNRGNIPISDIRKKNPPSGDSERGRENAETVHPIPARKAHGARLTLAALPGDWEAWCTQERPDLDPERTWDGFRDYWVAQPGAKGVKADWLATWRNWVRRETAAGGERRLPARLGKGQAVADSNRKAGEDFICDAAPVVSGTVIDGEFRRVK